MNIKEVTRLVFKFLNSASAEYSPTDPEKGHQVGELAISWKDGSATIKTEDGRIIPLKGQGYLDLLEYIKSSTGIGSTATDRQSLQIDTSLLNTPNDAVKGVLKIRVTNEDGTTSMKAVSLISDAAGVMIQLPEGASISLKDFHTSVTAFMENTNTALADHGKRLSAMETANGLATKDKNVFYQAFSEEEALNLAYEINVGAIADGTIKRHLLEVITTLDMDSGASANRHQVLITVNGIDRNISARVNSIGSAVDLAVEFYIKNNKVYVRPVHIDGEFIVKDKSLNIGSYKDFGGSIAKVAFDSLSLDTMDLLEVSGGGSGNGAASYKVTQEAHGFPPLSAVTYHDGLWKLASLNDPAKALAVANDENVFTVITGGHFQVPTGALDDDGEAFRDGEYYFLSQTTHGAITKKDPTLVYQDLGYCYTKGGVPFFVADIETPIDLESEAVQDLATKGELSKRQLVVQSEEEIRSLTLPIGTFITVASGIDGHYRKVEEVGTAGTVATINGKFANIVDTNKYIEDLKTLIATKLNIGGAIDSNYDTAVKIVAKLLDIDVKKLNKGTFNGDADTLVALINERLLASKSCNDFTTGGTDTYATGELVKQLYLIVQTIQNGGSLRSLLKVEKLSMLRTLNTLHKGSKTITSDKGFFFDPSLFIEGQFQHPSTYTVDKVGGVITLNEAYSLTTDVPYEVVDEYPSDVKFAANTVLYVTGSNLKDDLGLDDVVKILGDSEPNDGGHHLRVVQNVKKLNGIDLGNGLWFNEVPYSRPKSIAEEAREDVNCLAGAVIGKDGITRIQEVGTKVSGRLYKDIATGKMYLCTADTTTTVLDSSKFTDISSLALKSKLDNLDRSPMLYHGVLTGDKDINTIRYTGYWCFYTEAGLPSNMPVAGMARGVIEIIHAGGHIWQTVTHYGGITYKRYIQDDYVGPWRRIEATAI